MAFTCSTNHYLYFSLDLWPIFLLPSFVNHDIQLSVAFFGTLARKRVNFCFLRRRFTSTTRNCYCLLLLLYDDGKMYITALVHSPNRCLRNVSRPQGQMDRLGGGQINGSLQFHSFLMKENRASGQFASTLTCVNIVNNVTRKGTNQRLFQ